MSKPEHAAAPPPRFRAATGPGGWEEVPVLTYKEEGAAPFKSVTRQVLFAAPDLKCEWRYFEVAPKGHSTLERHEHVHAVMIHRGQGQCMIGDKVWDVKQGDLIHIPSMTWHQFRANQGRELGFLCLVNAERDKPQLPDEAQLAELKRNKAVAAFLA